MSQPAEYLHSCAVCHCYLAATPQTTMATPDLKRPMGIIVAEGHLRQTIYAIEAGTYVPNTAVSLQLARVLEVGVEELFSLEGEPAPETEHVAADLLGPGSLDESRPVRVARLGSRWVAVPASTTLLRMKPCSSRSAPSIPRLYAIACPCVTGPMIQMCGRMPKTG